MLCIRCKTAFCHVRSGYIQYKKKKYIKAADITYFWIYLLSRKYFCCSNFGEFGIKTKGRYMYSRIISFYWFQCSATRCCIISAVVKNFFMFGKQFENIFRTCFLNDSFIDDITYFICLQIVFLFLFLLFIIQFTGDSTRRCILELSSHVVSLHSMRNLHTSMYQNQLIRN